MLQFMVVYVRLSEKDEVDPLPSHPALPERKEKSCPEFLAVRTITIAGAPGASLVELHLADRSFRTRFAGNTLSQAVLA